MLRDHEARTSKGKLLPGSLSLGSLALVEASCHILRTLKCPQRKSTGRGTEVSCQRAGPPTHINELPWKWLLQPQSSLQMMQPHKYLVCNFMETLSQNCLAKSLPDSQSTETEFIMSVFLLSC